MSDKKSYLLHPATFKLDGGAMFGIIPKPLWEKKITPDEFNRISMSLRCVYLERNNRKILIDTGIGFHHNDKFNQQFALQNNFESFNHMLQECVSICCDEITDVILTHLHFDHAGGLGDGESHFKNANLWVHEKHLEYAKNPSLRDGGSFHAHSFLPIIEQAQSKGRLKLLGEENIGSIPELEMSYFTSRGHTPYMIHPIFDQYIYMADLVPMSHHIHIPWVMGYDIEPAVTTLYKEKCYQHILDQDLTMIYEHDTQFWGAGLEKTPKKFTAKNIQSSEIKHSVKLN